ncbi:MAG: mechanosensitive ion channel [Nitrososphaerota archaeon]
MARIIIYIVLYIVVAAILQWFFSSFLPSLGINITEYMGYVHVLLALAFGYLIVNSVGIFFYWSLRSKYDHATAAAVRNLVKIIGIGALVASIAGGVAGGAAGVALGGFLGIVIGFASQQVLGQAIAGFFLLITRPYKIGDLVVLGGEEGVVDEVSTLFTVVIKSDGTKVLIPNNSIVGSKIYLKQKT